MALHTVEAVEAFRDLLSQMLREARLKKQTTKIEPALNKADFGNIEERLLSVNGLIKPSSAKKTAQYAVVETAVRDAFNELLASESIEQAGFVQMWNLLDLVSFFSDDEQCDPALLFWLVEEILDSQTIAGCRNVFDYLESRRERITAKHFAQKNLVILRTCNELLKRLSRAEDTAFCGRVFIFMFQSFPLGDKSSVNLRGEYHVENVTSFDDVPAKTQPSEEMDLDPEPKEPPTGPAADMKTSPPSVSKQSVDSKFNTKSVTFDSKKPGSAERPLDPDELYPIFWSLQQNFSQPKTLFDSSHFTSFKKGLEATMVTFETIQAEQQARGGSKSVDDGRRGIKRKRGQGDEDLANTFNPKYLTSRDLFELEISDLSFRRHIAVQALIILDFLLSLSPKAKEKLTTITAQNKSVMYQDQLLSEDDTQWALDTKKRIAEYLKKGAEGPFFYRMVETVLSRDKNWVRWKIENCPSIVRPAVSAEAYLSAKAAAKRAATSKRLRPHPQMSLDLKFLIDAEGTGGMEKLKESRFNIPTLDDFRKKIADDDFEIEMPTNEETKEQAINGKASKSWRALRIASKNKLATFDKIDDPEKIDIIFTSDDSVDQNVEPGQDSTNEEDYPMPKDGRPVVLSGPARETVWKAIMAKYPKTFGKTISHTTRTPLEGETNGIDYHFVTKEDFNVMRDGDQLLEYIESDGHGSGTNRKAVESIIAAGKVPVLHMDSNQIQQLKDQSFSARYVLLATPNLEELERSLREAGSEAEEDIKAQIEMAKTEIEKSQTDGFYDKTINNEHPEKASEELESYIFGKEEYGATNMAQIVDAALPDISMDGASDAKEFTQVENTDRDVSMTDATSNTDATAEPKT